MAFSLLQIGSHDVDQFGSSFATFLLTQLSICDVVEDVVFDDFGHEAVDCAPNPGDELQDFGAASFVLQHPLHALNLGPEQEECEIVR
jgi:hypothetical protein